MPEQVSFEVVPGDPTSPYIVHVPHSSTRIPDDVRPQLVDLHSYRVQALPRERHQDAPRPPARLDPLGASRISIAQAVIVGT